MRIANAKRGFTWIGLLILVLAVAIAVLIYIDSESIHDGLNDLKGGQQKLEKEVAEIRNQNIVQQSRLTKLEGEIEKTKGNAKNPKKDADPQGKGDANLKGKEKKAD